MTRMMENVTIVQAKKYSKKMKKSLDKRYSMWYKYKYSSLMRIESRAGRGCDTLRLHQNLDSSELGGEIGSTDGE